MAARKKAAPSAAQPAIKSHPASQSARWSGSPAGWCWELMSLLKLEPGKDNIKRETAC